MLLFINACVRGDSRTKRLADCLLETLDTPYTELRLEALSFPRVNEAFLTARDEKIKARAFDDPMFTLARQFAGADEIVIAAPFWDLSFPAALKAYLEQITAVGLTFRYTPEGVPVGLCRAKRLIYVTTVGGPSCPESFGFGYVEALAKGFYGIGDVELVKVCGLDIIGAPVEELLLAGEKEIKERFQR